MNRRRLSLTSLLLLPALLATMLPGCGSLFTSDEPARQVYLLQPLAGEPAAGTGAPGIALSVRAVPGLDTDRILALAPDARVNHYANARWPDFLPEVVASAVQRSLESSGGFGAVNVTDRPATGDWSLDLEIRAFYGLQAGSGDTESVHVELAGALTCGDTSTTLDLRETRPVSSQNLAAIVAAHQAGLDSVTRQLLTHLAEDCSNPGPDG